MIEFLRRYSPLRKTSPNVLPQKKPAAGFQLTLQVIKYRAVSDVYFLHVCRRGWWMEGGSKERDSPPSLDNWLEIRCNPSLKHGLLCKVWNAIKQNAIMCKSHKTHDILLFHLENIFLCLIWWQQHGGMAAGAGEGEWYLKEHTWKKIFQPNRVNWY